MYTVNCFQGSRWITSRSEATKSEAITTLARMYDTGEYTCVNVESPNGTVVYVRKESRRQPMDTMNLVYIVPVVIALAAIRCAFIASNGKKR